MHVNRRTFLFLSTTFAAGCATVPGGANFTSGNKDLLVNAGPAGQYLADGVYTRFRDLGFFVVRRGANLFALSAVCTHKKCKLDAGLGETFHCPCHGSTFNPDGKVTKGPARRNLPVLELSTDENGNLLVKIPAA